MSTDEFEDLIDQIALESGCGTVPSAVPCPASVASLTLLAASILVGVAFFFLGLVLLFVCIGFLAWAAGAAVLILISGPGAVAGLIGAIHDRHSAAGLIIGLLGFLFNAAVTVAGAWYLVAFMEYWR